MSLGPIDQHGKTHEAGGRDALTGFIAAPLTGEVTTAASVATVDKTAITGKTEETAIASDDMLLISDTSDSSNLKKFSRNNFMNFASQADQEAGTSTVKPVVPNVQHYHPSAAKAWIRCNDAVDSSPEAHAYYNVNTSITYNGVGDYTFNIETDLSAVGCYVASGARDCVNVAGYTASTVTVRSTSNAGTAQEDAQQLVVFGDM